MRRVAVLLLLATSAFAQHYEPNWESLDKRPTPDWFTDAKFGIFIHWGVYSVPAYAPVLPNELAYAEWYWHAITEGRKPGAKPIDADSWDFHTRVYGADFPYADFASQFKAELFDPDHWADVFAASGAKYVVLTSKHHEGFALWPSEQASADWGRPWNAVEIGPHRDLLGDLSKAVRAKGVRMGYYYSLYEWYNPLWLTDKSVYVSKHMHPQFKDLVTHYRPDIIFADGQWDLTSAEWHSPELLAWLFNDSPVKDKVVINDRWGSDTVHKHGGYWTTEYTAGMSGMQHPWEESRGMGYSYGFNRDEQLADYHTARQLVLMLVDIVSRGGNLLLDIGPRADGHVPVVMEERLRSMGDWLKVNGDAIYGTHPWKDTRQWSAGRPPDISYNKAFKTPYDVSRYVEKTGDGTASIEAFFTAKGKDVYAILPRWPVGTFVVKHVGQGVKSVGLMGQDAPLKWKAVPGGIEVTMPERPEQDQIAWVLRISE